MNQAEIVFQAIGTIHSPHQEPSQIPIQPVYSTGIPGKAVVKPEFANGLMDLGEFSHVYLFYYFHQAEETHLRVKPYLSEQEHGVFATRAPHRPNKLGMSLVRLISIEGNTLSVEDIDILDGTPLIDIKPYVQRFDSRDNARSGWQDAITDDTAAIRGLRNYKR